MLEGDVANVGIIAGGDNPLTAFIIKKQTKLGNIPLVTGRYIKTMTEYVDKKHLDKEEVRRRIKKLVGEGAQIIVGTEIYGVDDDRLEAMVAEVARKKVCM